MEQEELTPKKPKLPIRIRYTEPGDAKFLKEWLLQPSVGRWFPMSDQLEVEDAVNRWISFCRYKCSLTALYEDQPCGLVTLYLQPYRKLAHQTEFGIIVGDQYRGQGVGSELMTSAMQLAKENFKIELLHLTVYAENPAIRLYKRFGFQEFGRQTHWIKDQGVYYARIFMERMI